MAKMKNNLILAFFILAGVILGSLLAGVAEGVPLLSWLAYGKTIGIPTQNPMYLDLAIVRIAFGLEMGINVAQIFTILFSLVCYKAMAKKL